MQESNSCLYTSSFKRFGIMNKSRIYTVLGTYSLEIFRKSNLILNSGSLVLQCEVCDSATWHLAHFHLLHILKSRANKPSRIFNGFKSVISHTGLFPEEQEVVMLVTSFNGVESFSDLLK